MTDSPQDLPERQPLPPAVDIGTHAQFAAIGLVASGVTSMVISGFSLCMGIATSVMMFSMNLTYGLQSSGDSMFFIMTALGLAFSLSFLFPLATGAGSVYGGLMLNAGGSPTPIRVAAIGMVVGHAFLIVGAIPGLIIGGCTSALLLLSSPFIAILAVGSAVLTFVAVRDGELLQHDNTAEPLETS